VTGSSGLRVEDIPQPDAGTLMISGKGLKTKTRNVADNGKAKLLAIPKGAKRRIESLTRKIKLRAKITYRPTGAPEDAEEPAQARQALAVRPVGITPAPPRLGPRWMSTTGRGAR
jgi:hypothetical protein